MSFWIIVLVVIVVALVAGWLYDRRHKGSVGGIDGPQNDGGVNTVRAEREKRDLGGLGPGRGP